MGAYWSNPKTLKNVSTDGTYFFKFEKNLVLFLT